VLLIFAERQTNLAAGALLVGLGNAGIDHDAILVEGQIAHLNARKLRSSESTGEAGEHECFVSRACQRPRARSHNFANVFGEQWRLSDLSGTDHAANSFQVFADDEVVRR
jgi:hypothetical protein